MLPNESQLDEEGVAIVRLVVAGGSSTTYSRVFFLFCENDSEQNPIYISTPLLSLLPAQHAVTTLATAADLTINILRRPYR